MNANLRTTMRHYLMTTDEHFEAAIKGEREAAQKAAQPMHAEKRRESLSLIRCG